MPIPRSDETREWTETGDDYVEFESVVVKKELNISTGSGNDTLWANHLQALDRFYLDMGKGVDTANLTESSIRRAWFDIGDGANRLRLSNARVGPWKLLRF